jgi:hypothetical protein
MSFVAGSVEGTLGWDVSPFRQAFLQTQGLMQTFPSLVTTFMASPMLGFANAAKSAVGVASSALHNLIDVVLESADAADAMGDMATNVGVSVEALSGLGLVAKQAGASVEAVADAYKFLGKSQAEAIAGIDKSAAKIFKDLGISLRDAAGNARPLEAVMMDVADGITATGASGDRTRIAMELLGRSGTDLIATLSQGSDAIKEQISRFDSYGAVIHSTAVQSGDAFNDLLGEVKIAWGGIQNLIGEPLREELTPLLQNAVNFVGANMPKIRETIGQATDFTVAKLNEVTNWTISHWPEIKSALGDAKTLVESLASALQFLLTPLQESLAALGRLADFTAESILGSVPQTIQPLRTREDAQRDQAASIIVNVSAPDPSETANQVGQRIVNAVRGLQEQSKQSAGVIARQAQIQAGL